MGNTEHSRKMETTLLIGPKESREKVKDKKQALQSFAAQLPS